MASARLFVFLGTLLFVIGLAYAAGGFFSEAERQKMDQLLAYGKKQEVQDFIGARLKFLNDTQGLKNQRETRAVEAKQEECECECKKSDISFITPGSGYGRYCGAGFGCDDKKQGGCDAADECCKSHDKCVGDSGYCDSCDCNVKLVKCLDKISSKSKGFSPCNSLQKAKDSMLDDLCKVIDNAPGFCGGCDSEFEDEVEKECAGHGFFSAAGSLSPPSIFSSFFLSSFILVALAFLANRF
jgi:hypothetical protein